MADAGSSSDVAKAIGHPFVTFFAWLVEFIPEPLRPLVYLIVGIGTALSPFIFKYYLGILAQGAQPQGSLERKDYDALRASLEAGNLAARLYAKWLTRFLDAVERFFGDAGMADRTLFPHAFGLRKPAPLWTAPAFDRCLYLALIYPIATIFVIWAISGSIGMMGTIGLHSGVPGWSRALLAAAIGFLSFAVWRGVRVRGWKSRLWIAVTFAGASSVAFAFARAVYVAIASDVAGDVAGAFGIAFAIAIAFAGADAVAGVGVGGVFGAVADAGVGDVAGAVLVTFTVAVAGAFTVAVAGLSESAIKHRLQGVFLSLFLAVMISACLGLAAVLSPLTTWRPVGDWLLVWGLLTLLNAPFDWASLGLTRALLRRGLELGGWWPYLLAVVDAALAGLVIVLLTLTMVIGVQAFDELAVHGGDVHALPLGIFFNFITEFPAEADNWWAYALLLSSMIPSLVNLAISGMALTRGIPGVSRLLLRWIPEGRDVPDYRRPLAAVVLTSQMFAGAGLGIAAQAFLAGASFSMSCPGLASTCSTWPAPSPFSTCRCGLRSFSSAYDSRLPR